MYASMLQNSLTWYFRPPSFKLKLRAFGGGLKQVFELPVPMFQGVLITKLHLIFKEKLA